MKLVLALFLFLTVCVVAHSFDLLSVATGLLYKSILTFNDLFKYARFEVTSTSEDPDTGRRTPEIIKSRGFDVEIHRIETQDEYILSIHRLVKKRSKLEKRRRRAKRSKLKTVILHHGLLGSSVDFVINSPGGCADESTDEVGNNLAFELAKRDYDVWLANVRGNMYSLDHKVFKSTDREFWDFSLDEHIQYDLPAVIDYIKDVCNASTLAYVGFSQGTTMMFGLLASQPEYSESIRPFIAMAPVGDTSRITSPVGPLLETTLFMQVLSRQSGPFLPDSLVRWVSEKFCHTVSNRLCANALFFIVGGWDSPQFNVTRVPVYTSTQAYGTSIKNIVHWSQLIRAKSSLAHFDYGEEGNLIYYGRTDAPVYPLEAINSSYIAIFSGLNDAFATPQNVQQLRQLLTVELVDDYTVEDKLWTHLDFIFAKETGKYINSRVLSLLNSYA